MFAFMVCLRYIIGMNWRVELTKKSLKNLMNLSETIQQKYFALFEDIKFNGPIRGNWPNFSKLENDCLHCHIKKGNPTYVCVWEVKNKTIKIVEVKYVGTHEKAPY